MFLQKFKLDEPISFVLVCQGDENGCGDVPVMLKVMFPLNPIGKTFPFPSEYQEEMTASMSKRGLSEKCRECLIKNANANSK
ncbi:MAG: hypothetical protein FWE17_01975 [Alphaproteobacteria bacterium]|nr:hypothetical protein [Alphaproteobacteria bacterium]MCL2757792.1 hypothetical protein [Alphaproteobacteria bacterium]